MCPISEVIITDVYQWDSDGDGIPNSPAHYFIGANESVSFDNSRTDACILKWGAYGFMNSSFIGTVWHNANYTYDITFIRPGNAVRLDKGSAGIEDFQYFNQWSYNNDGTMTFTGDVWTKN